MINSLAFFVLFLNFDTAFTQTQPSISATTFPITSTPLLLGSTTATSPASVTPFSAPLNQTIPNSTLLSKRLINVGILIPNLDPSLINEVGYEKSIGAINVAMDRIVRERLLDGFNFTFQVRISDCIEYKSLGNAVELIQDYDIDVIIGPTCNIPAIAVGALAKFYKVPVFTWGLTTSRVLADLNRFPTILMTSGNSLELGRAFVLVMQQFGWSMFAFIYSTNEHQRCNFIRSDMEVAVDESSYELFISFSRRVDNISLSSVRNVMKEAVKSARVFVICLDNDDDKRTFFLTIYDLGLNTDDYVYILLELRNLQFNITTANKTSSGDQSTTPIWIDQKSPLDGRDQDAYKGIAKAFVLDLSGETTANLTQFRQDMMQKVVGWPFYCQECVQSNGISTFASQLSDTFYLYGVALNKTLKQLSSSIYSAASIQNLRLGPQIIQNIVGYSFAGISGQITMDSTGSRDSIFYFSGLSSNAKNVAYLEIKFTETNWSVKALYPESTIWANRAGIRPLDQPKCGFNGSKCQPDAWATYGVYIVIAAVSLFLLLASTVIFFIQTRRNEIKRLNLLWQVRFIELHRPIKKDPNAASQRSFQSGKQSQMTLETKKETQNFLFFYYREESVAARKFQFRSQLFSQDVIQIRAMCRVENENLGKFVGLCLDGPICMAVWRYYDRGSIQDVVAKSTFAMDDVFILSLIRDIVQGITFIHAAPFLNCHGRLTSSNCFVDERWVVKVGDYGLDRIYDEEPIRQSEMLWMAPEHIREVAINLRGSKSGDIYSFGIICSEIITKRPAWGIESNNEKLEDHINRIKRGGKNPPRPSLETSEGTYINNAVFHLIRDCWEENPRSRPSITQIRSLLRSIGGRNENIMDHVFRILEQYTTNLQQEVEERTKELMEEKKRSDLLLYRMLPPQVADKLKSGSTVEPESYDSVTVFFSDICRFAEIASKCSPLQVINLLNDLFIMFDEIIETFDCYKVESVGDGTLVVSGLPRRNGISHVREIANMSLSFISNVANFRIVHLSSEVVTIRIGFHSGPCVAGIVGLTMPRFCLFGDTINTASRMESNGRPSQIHLSSDSNNLLQIAGDFKTESRGEIIIKGKGVMETYWLISGTNDESGNKNRTAKNMSSTANSKDPLYRQFLRNQK